MAITLYTLKNSTVDRGTIGKERKLTVADGTVVAVIDIPVNRPIVVDVEPDGAAVATAYITLESDNDAIAAGSAASTWLREWPNGGVTVATTNTFSESVYAVVCASTGGNTIFRVRC